MWSAKWPWHDAYSLHPKICKGNNPKPPNLNIMFVKVLKNGWQQKKFTAAQSLNQKTDLNMTLAIWLPAPSSAIPPASGFTRGIGLGVAGRDLASCSRQLILIPRPISAVSEASTLTLGAGRADWGRLELLVMSWLMFPPLWSSAMPWASGFTLHITAWVECQWWTRKMTEKLGYSDIICPYPLGASKFVSKLSRIFFLFVNHLFVC